MAVRNGHKHCFRVSAFADVDAFQEYNRVLHITWSGKGHHDRDSYGTDILFHARQLQIELTISDFFTCDEHFLSKESIILSIFEKTKLKNYALPSPRIRP